MLDRCNHSWALGTPGKYECDILKVTCVLCILKHWKIKKNGGNWLSDPHSWSVTSEQRDSNVGRSSMVFLFIKVIMIKVKLQGEVRYNGCFLHTSCRTLQWHHNECKGISNHQRLDCLLNSLFRCRSKKHQSSASFAFMGEFTGDHWIPPTKGQ